MLFFLTLLRRYNIYFLNVMWQGSFRIRSISFSIFNHPQVFPLRWVLGLEIFLKSFKIRFFGGIGSLLGYMVEYK